MTAVPAGMILAGCLHQGKRRSCRNPLMIPNRSSGMSPKPSATSRAEGQYSSGVSPSSTRLVGLEVALRVVGARAAALRGGGIRPFCGPGEKGPCGPAPGEALSCRRLRELGEAAPQVAGRARRPRSSADLRARLMVSRLGGSTPDARADDGIPRGRRGPATRGSVRAVKTSWTSGELRVLEMVAEEKGWEWTRRNAVRILEEARMVEGPDLEGLDEPLPV